MFNHIRTNNNIFSKDERSFRIFLFFDNFVKLILNICSANKLSGYTIAGILPAEFIIYPSITNCGFQFISANSTFLFAGSMVENFKD